MQTIWIRNNMAFLYRYWSTAGRALELVVENPDQYEEFEDNEPGGYVEAVVASHLDNHNYAAVLLTYAIFDEFFVALTTDLGKRKGVSQLPTQLRERGVKRYRKFVHHVCAVPPTDLGIDWEFLEDFATIRNCIVHANGNKSLVRNRPELERLLRRHGPQISLKDSVRVVVSSEFVERCMVVTQTAALALNAALSELPPVPQPS